MEGESRTALRKTIRQRRTSLDTVQINRSAELLLQNLLKLPQFLEAQRISAYLALWGEMDPTHALRWARENHKITCLPVMRNEILYFAPFTEETPMLAGRFGISVPNCDEQEMLQPDELDLVLVPMVGFDEKLNRLGMGGGFYDRTFSFRAGNLDKPCLIGVAHEFQKQPILDTEPWDIPMDAIVTEKSVYSC